MQNFEKKRIGFVCPLVLPNTDRLRHGWDFLLKGCVEVFQGDFGMLDGYRCQ